MADDTISVELECKVYRLTAHPSYPGRIMADIDGDSKERRTKVALSFDVPDTTRIGDKFAVTVKEIPRG